MTTINAHLINWIALQIVVTASSRGPVSGCDGDLEVPPGSPILEHSSLVRATYLRLAETLTTFLTRLRSSADALDISERQRVLRLLVKEILVGDDKIVIRYCIPLPTGGNGPRAKSANAAAPSTEGYLFDNRVRHEVAGIEWYQRNAASRRHQRKGHRQDAAGRGTGSSDAIDNLRCWVRQRSHSWRAGRCLPWARECSIG